MAVMGESTSYFKDKNETSSWQFNPFWASPEQRYADVESQIQEGEGFLEAQKCYKDFPRNLRVGSLIGFEAANGAESLLALYNKIENKGHGY